MLNQMISRWKLCEKNFLLIQWDNQDGHVTKKWPKKCESLQGIKSINITTYMVYVCKKSYESQNWYTENVKNDGYV